jgi:hypothetical protein
MPSGAFGKLHFAFTRFHSKRKILAWDAAQHNHQYCHYESKKLHGCKCNTSLSKNDISKRLKTATPLKSGAILVVFTEWEMLILF